MDKVIVRCAQCAQQLRVPAQRDWEVTCIRCKHQWKLIRSQGKTMDTQITDVRQLPGLEELTQEQLQKVLEKIQKTMVNVLLVGGTGVGKSSTINGLFQNAKMPSSAKVGETSRPETMEVQSYTLNNVVIWDTPGLGDSTEKDQIHIEKITQLLRQEDSDGLPLIDLVFLVLDAGSRDFGSVYKIIQEVIVPNLAEGPGGAESVNSRLLIGINKIDKIKHHSYWDAANNAPSEKLLPIIDDMVDVVRKRIAADTSCSPEIITYCAGETVDGEVLQEPYNLGKLLSFILDRIPSKKRIAFSNDINKNKGNFSSNDRKENYQEKIENSIFKSFKEVVMDVVGHAMQVVRTIVVDTIKDPIIHKKVVSMGVDFIMSLLKKGK